MMFAATASASSVAAEPNPTPNTLDFTCVVSALPHGVPGSSSSTTKLSGPAVSALTGGAARHGFSLDGGDLVVKPPRRGDAPLLSANQAICGAMASTAGLSGSVTQGVAAGYGRVSVAARFFPAITGFPSPGDVAAKYPMVASFHNRLAWLVVVHTFPAAYSCPAESGPVRLVPRLSDHGYEVFMIDARTGTDALVYREGGPGGCSAGARVPPSVGVAEESVSVPWTLVSRVIPTGTRARLPRRSFLATRPRAPSSSTRAVPMSRCGSPAHSVHPAGPRRRSPSTFTPLWSPPTCPLSSATTSSD